MKSELSDMIVHQFLGIFEKLRERYDVRLHLSSDRNVTGSDSVAIVSPVNPNAALIDARLDLDFGVYLLLGAQAAMEVPLNGGSYLGQPCIEETTSLCDAVTHGMLREEVTYSGMKPLKGSFTLEVSSGKILSESWRKLYVYPFKRRVRKIFSYEPYRLRD